MTKKVWSFLRNFKNVERVHFYFYWIRYKANKCMSRRQHFNPIFEFPKLLSQMFDVHLSLLFFSPIYGVFLIHFWNRGITWKNLHWHSESRTISLYFLHAFMMIMKGWCWFSELRHDRLSVCTNMCLCTNYWIFNSFHTASLP